MSGHSETLTGLDSSKGVEVRQRRAIAAVDRDRQNLRIGVAMETELPRLTPRTLTIDAAA